MYEENIKNFLIEQLERTRDCKKNYIQRMGELLHGYLYVRTIQNKEYLYCSFKIKRKTKTMYVGKNTEENKERFISENIRYNRLKNSVKELKDQERKLEKAIKLFL